MNKRIFLFVFVLFFSIFFISFVSASTNINQCAVLSSAGETYLLNTSFTNTTAGTCINITANNITLDCQNYLITGARTNNSWANTLISNYAIYSIANNISIKNCNITYFQNGIYLSGISNNIIYNNNLSNLNGYGAVNPAGNVIGIYINNSNNVSYNILSNLKGGMSSSADNAKSGNVTGIYSVNSTLNNNNLSNLYGGSGAGYTLGERAPNGGLAFGLKIENSLANNNILTNIFGGNASASGSYSNSLWADCYGIYSVNSTLNNNNLSNLFGGHGTAAGGSGYGIAGRAYGAFLSNSTLNNTNIYNLKGGGRYFGNNGEISYFIYSNNSNITNNNFSRIDIINDTVGDSSGSCSEYIYANYLITNNRFINNIVSDVDSCYSTAGDDNNANPSTLSIYGIYSSSKSNVIFNNNISMLIGIRGGSGSNSAGTNGVSVYGFYGNSSNISNNRIYNLYGGPAVDDATGGTTIGIYVFNDMNKPLISNNYVYNLLPGDGADAGSNSGLSYGIYGNNVTIFNNTLYNIFKNSIVSGTTNKAYAIYIGTITSSNVSDNNIYNMTNSSYQYCVYVNSINNLFYNNIFNCSSYFSWGTSYLQQLNTTETNSRNIYGGSKIGGNYWTNSTNNGFSDTCSHTIEPSFCNTNYTIATNFIDYLPLANFTNPISLNLINPTNYYNSSISQVNFFCNTSSSGSNITNISLYGNWSGSWKLNYTNDTVSLNTNYSQINKTYFLNDGGYIYNCLSYDNQNNSQWGVTNYTFVVDTQKPNVTLNSPANLTTINQSSIFNCSGKDNIQLKNISLYTNVSGAWDITNSTNVTGSNNETTFLLNTIEYSSGTYLWSCGVCDSAGNCNNSFVENRTFIINKSIDVVRINSYFSKDLNSLMFHNNITFVANISSPGGLVTYTNFSVKDPNGVVRIYNVNGTRDTNTNWNTTTKTLLNVSGTWEVNVSALNELNESAILIKNFTITDVVNYLNSYQYSTQTTDRGTNITYNLTLWHDSEECFNFTFTPYLNYSDNFTIYIQNTSQTICSSSIYTPSYNLVTIYINSSVVDGLYYGNISINRTNTSTAYLHTINLTVNPPTASPYLYDLDNISVCESTYNGNCSWERGGQVGIFYFKSYIVKNLGEYNAKKCNLILNTNETGLWDYTADLKNFDLDINSSKEILLSIRVLSGYGETKQAYVGITCDNSTPWGYPASTSPSNSPIIYWIIDALPQSNIGSGGGGGSGAQTTPSYVCDNKNLSWKAENDRGGGSYYFLMLPDEINGIREGKVVLTNIFKTNTIKISADCFDGGFMQDDNRKNNSNICKYVKLSKNSVELLPTAATDEIVFNIDISQADYKIGDRIYSSMLLRDEFGCEYYFPITIEISQKASIFSFSGIFDKLKECKPMFGMCINYTLLMLFLFLITFIIVAIILFYSHIESYMLYSILISIISTTILYIFI